MECNTTITPPNNLDQDRAAIYAALLTLPEYQSYRNTASIQKGFIDLCEQYKDSDEISVHLEAFTPEADSKKDIKMLVIELSKANNKENDHLSTGLFIGNVHTNELVWTLTVDFLPKLFCANPDLMRRLGCKKIIVFDAYPGTIDHNGPELLAGEGALKLIDYYKAAWRSNLQPEWDLSFDYKEVRHVSTMLGAKAIEYAIDTYKTDLVQPGHNAATGGVYWYLTSQNTVLAKDLGVLAGAVGVPFGEPDFKKAIKVAPGVFITPTGIDLYAFWDYTVQSMGDNAPGYQQRKLGPLTLSIVSEGAYFSSELINSTEPSGLTEEKMQNLILPFTATMWQIMSGILDKCKHKNLSANDKMLYEATKFYYEIMKHCQYGIKEKLKSQQQTTKGEVAAFCESFLSHPAVGFGHAYRLAVQTGDSVSAQAAEQALIDAANVVERFLEPLFIPRRKQVALQAGGFLLALLGLKEKRLQNSLE